MQKGKRTLLPIISVLTYLVLAFYVAWFVMVPTLNKFDDSSLNGFLNDGINTFLDGHFDSLIQLFIFNHKGGIIPSLIGIGFIFLSVVLILLAVKYGLKYKRSCCANGMIAIYLANLPVLISASGFSFYLDVIKQVGVYGGEHSFIKTSILILLIAAMLYVLLAIILYIVCWAEAKKFPGSDEEFNEEKTTAKQEEVKEKVPEVVPPKVIEKVEEPVREVVTQSIEEDEDEIDLEELGMKVEELAALIKKIVHDELAENAPKGKAKKEKEVIAPAPTAKPSKTNAFVRVAFADRILKADKEVQKAYNEIKNEFLSYGIHSRMASGGDTFRLHRKTYGKVAMAGKGLKVYLALNPKDYIASTIPFTDASSKAMYAEIPFVFKVKSDLSRKRIKTLIADAMAKDGIEQNEIEPVDFIKEMKAELKRKK